MKKLVVKGKIGRVGMPTGGPRRWPKIMKRAEHSLRQIFNRERRRRKRGLTDKDPINTLTGFSPFEVRMAGAIDMEEEKHDNGMLALAESLASRKEILAILTPMGEEELLRVKRAHHPIQRARRTIIDKLTRHCKNHHYGNFKRKTAIDRITKRLLKGYQHWWVCVQVERRRIEKRAEQNGHYVARNKVIERAVRMVSPELFPEDKTCW